MTVIVHEDVVCAYCGCLCDDLRVEVEDNKITKVSHVCAVGKNKLMHAQSDIPPFMINGLETTMQEAVAEAARILADAKAPMIYGLSSTSTEAINEAVALTELIGGMVDNCSSY